jgi:hypothetical protein
LFFEFDSWIWIQNSKIQMLLNKIWTGAQTKINLNKLFEDFSNMKLLKNRLNIQIQTKALNGGLLKMIRKKILKNAI